MPKSKGLKFWNKFERWASHEGIVQAEVAQGMEEFFVDPNRVPHETRQQLRQLFTDWFLLDRKLIRAPLTPMGLYLKAQERRLGAEELAIYRRFSDKNQFGLFRVDETRPGESMDISLMPEGRRFHVVEMAGSQSAKKGDYLIVRLLPFEDHWAMTGVTGAFPSEHSYSLDRAFSGKKKDDPGKFGPRDALGLFMPKIDWMREGLPRVKARLAMLLQRWGVSDITATSVGADIEAAHKRKALELPSLKDILGRAPSLAEAQEMTALLTAWWNLTLLEPEKHFPRGPKETTLLADLRRVVTEKLRGLPEEDADAAAELSREATKEWLDAPQKELEGKTPMEVIRAERKSLGNPREEFGVSLLPTSIRLGKQAAEGQRLANEGRDHLMSRKPREALECLEKAYRLIKDYPESFRILGNMATANVMLGRRDQAMEMLRAALKANPDYDLARNNLRLLEGMSPAEFDLRHREGFFEKMNVVRENGGA